MGSFSKANCKFKGELQIFKGELQFALTHLLMPIFRKPFLIDYKFRTDTIMKKALLFLLFFTTVVYSQQDTIQIKERDIIYIHKEYPNEPENVLDFKHGTYYYALCKSPHERLEGFFC